MRPATTITLVLFISTAVLQASQFVDTFEAEAVGTFPSQWSYFHDNADSAVIDEAMDLGGVFAGEKSLRLTFNGGYGSGIQTTIAPLTEGVVSFYARTDSVSDRVQLMGLCNYEDTEAPGSFLTMVQVKNGYANYFVDSVDTNVPIVFGEYAHFELYFDIAVSTCTLLINGIVTNAIDVPLRSPSSGITTLRSNHVTDPGGYAEWYLDDVSVVPEPATMSLLALGGLALLKRRKT